MPYGLDRFITLDDVEEYERIVIYGAGGHGVATLKSLVSQRTIDFQFFLDSFQDGEVEGYKIFSFPKSKTPEDIKDVHIIVASHYWKEIADILIKHDVHNFSIIDPSIHHVAGKDTFYHTIEDCYNLISKFKSVVDYIPRDDYKQSAVVLHQTENYVPLSELDTIWEGCIDYTDINAFRKTYAELPHHEYVAIVPSSGSRHTFYKTIL